MFKKLIFTVLCALPVALFAQEAKFGHINSQEIVSLMPEMAQIEKTVDELGKTYEADILKMQEEYNSKLKEFQDKQETMPEGVKKMRVAEIQEVESRVTNYRQVAYQEIQKKQQELFVPIRDKVTKAINDVAAEGKFTYILDLGSQAVIYKSPTSNDITAKVKAKLGLK